MKTRYTYYKGILKCQFSTIGRKPIGAVDQQSNFLLEPRFRLCEAVAIDETEMPGHDFLNEQAYIYQEAKAAIEIYTLTNPEGYKRNAESVLLILESSNQAPTKHSPIEEYLKSNKDEAVYYRSFSAVKDNVSHGKIVGNAYLKIVEYIDDNGEVVVEPVQSDHAGSLYELDKRLGCSKSRLFKSSIALADRNGCNPFSSFTNNSNLSLGSRGRLNLAGCMPMLKFLMALGLLFGLLSFLFKTCNNQPKTAVIPTPIHDTIYKEVIKTITDTLTIIKSDTLSFVDSTIKTTYEMVSLPNVQFYTNSHVLLPASAKDLQKLAEYLLKNEKLNATVYGHTDNVGNPENNLKLSQARAESVKQFLVNLGVSDNRLGAIGMGDTKPKGDNAKEEGRMLNRRVEVKLTTNESTETKRTQTNNQNKNSN